MANSICLICEKRGRHELIGSDSFKLCMYHNLLYEDNKLEFINRAKLVRDNTTNLDKRIELNSLIEESLKNG